MTRRPSGERVCFQRFLVLTFEQQGGELAGEGDLAGGELVQVYGRTNGLAFRAVAANRTAGINVDMSGRLTPGQMTGTYSGSGPEGTLHGSIALYR